MPEETELQTLTKLYNQRGEMLETYRTLTARLEAEITNLKRQLQHSHAESEALVVELALAKTVKPKS